MAGHVRIDCTCPSFGGVLWLKVISAWNFMLTIFLATAEIDVECFLTATLVCVLWMCRDKVIFVHFFWLSVRFPNHSKNSYKIWYGRAKTCVGNFVFKPIRPLELSDFERLKNNPVLLIDLQGSQCSVYSASYASAPKSITHFPLVLKLQTRAVLLWALSRMSWHSVRHGYRCVFILNLTGPLCSDTYR